MGDGDMKIGVVIMLGEDLKMEKSQQPWPDMNSLAPPT